MAAAPRVASTAFEAYGRLIPALRVRKTVIECHRAKFQFAAFPPLLPLRCRIVDAPTLASGRRGASELLRAPETRIEAH